MVWKDINKESRVLIDKLKLLSFKISAAESCTGGLLSSAIVNNSGASEAFERSFVTYSNEAKVNILKINNNIIEEFGAVSKQTAYHMASSLVNNFINISIIFLLFRFFDISKVGIKSIEKIPGTFGILFDDIIGGIYTIPIIYLIGLWFGKI